VIAIDDTVESIARDMIARVSTIPTDGADKKKAAIAAGDAANESVVVIAVGGRLGGREGLSTAAADVRGAT
jgi:hypothetical protein